MTDSTSGNSPPGAGPKGQFSPKGTLVMDAVPARPAVPPAQPMPPQGATAPSPQEPAPPQQPWYPPQGQYPAQPQQPQYAQQLQYAQPHAQQPQYAQPHAQQPQYAQQPWQAGPAAAPPGGAWPGPAPGQAAGWSAATGAVAGPVHAPALAAAQSGAVIAGLPALHGGATARPIVSGDHWPLPEGLLARLPQLPGEQAMEPHDAEVQFSGSGSAIDWLTYAAEVNERDNEAERIKKQLFLWGMVCVIGGVLTIPLFGFGLIPIGVAIYLFVRRKKFDKVDVDDRRLEAFTGALRTLAPELKPKKAITVGLDFTAHTRHVRNAAQHAPEYEQEWLSLKLPLQDGSHALMTVTVQVKERRKPKRKYTKIKRRQREQVVVRLTPPSGQAFSPNPRLNQTTGRVVNGLTLRQALVQPQLACFTWSSWVSTNTRSRGGWASHAPPLDSRHLVSTLIVSYKLARAAELGAA